MGDRPRPTKPIDKFIARADWLIAELDRAVAELTAIIDKEITPGAHKKAD